MSDHRQRISRLPILMYHAIAPFPSLISITPQTFTRQIEFLHNQGYHILPLLEAIDALQTGDGLPERALVLTFDDGFEGVYQHAFPVLTRYGYPATVFLVTGYCGKQNEWPGQPKDVPSLQLMSWEHIREMDRYGIEFGAHTVTHPRLDQLIDSQASHEVLESQEIIQDHLGHGVDTFAYPYGRLNPTVKETVMGSFAAACGTTIGVVKGSHDRFDLRRVEIHYVSSTAIFGGISSAWFPSYLAFRSILRNLAGTVFRRAWN